MHLKGDFLRARVEGISSPLLSLFVDKTPLSGRTVKYRIATVPKKIELSSECTYYDWETGLDVVIY